MVAEQLCSLHPVASSWNLYELTYRDDPSHMSEVLVESASAGEPLSGSRVVAATVLQEDCVDEFEALWQSTCTGTTTTACQEDLNDDDDDDDASTDSSQEAMQDLAPRSSDDEREVTDLEEAAQAVLQRRERKKSGSARSRLLVLLVFLVHMSLVKRTDVPRWTIPFSRELETICFGMDPRLGISRHGHQIYHAIVELIVSAKRPRWPRTRPLATWSSPIGW